MRWYGVNIPYLILSHPEIVGEDMISWTIAWEMHFMKAIQVFMTKSGEAKNRPGSRNNDSRALLLVAAGIKAKKLGLEDSCMPTGIGQLHEISILSLFVGHLESRKTALTQWCKEGSKAACFGLLKCTIKPFKISSTRQRVKTNVAFWLSMETT